MILSKDSLVRAILADIKDNSTGNISPLDVRQNLLNIIDSVHRLTEGHDLKANNFETINTRSTRVGDGAIKKLDLAGYATIDNTAVGFEALRENYSGERNVSLGTLALCCNIHGDDSVAIGSSAVAGNTLGNANIGIGSYTLHGNKVGEFNIAIGHAAGYYADTDDDYKFYLGSIPVTDTYICANPDGGPYKPLLMGDMSQSNLTLGIGVKTLRSNPSLIVDGHIEPHTTQVSDLGGSDYRFRTLYVKDDIDLRLGNLSYVDNRFVVSHSGVVTDTYIKSDLVTEDISASGITTQDRIISNSGISALGNSISHFEGRIQPHSDIIPNQHRLSTLGSSSNYFYQTYTHNLNVTGIARINQFEATTTSHFFNKVINLASSGNNLDLDGGDASGPHGNSQILSDEGFGVPYLSDEELDGAGLNVSASGTSYTRYYNLLFKKPDSLLGPFEGSVYNRAYWHSNIGFRTPADGNVHTGKIINRETVGLYTYDPNLTSELYYGVTVSGNRIYFSKTADSFDLNGSGDINFINDTSNEEEYIITTAAQHDDVNLTHRFVANASGDVNGFDISYISDSDLTKPEFFNESTEERPNRFVIKSYQDSLTPKRTFTFMQNATDGIIGVSNFDNSENMTPDTAFNIRTTGNAIIRSTAENLSNTRTALQLFTRENCPKYGVEFTYGTQTDIFDVYQYNDSKQTSLFKSKDNKLSIFGNPDDNPVEMLTLGGSGLPDAVISMHHVSKQPTHTEDFAKLYSEASAIDGQKSNLVYLDQEGNFFNVDVTPRSATGGEVKNKPLYVDDNKNTLGGAGTPTSIDQITTGQNNTGLGNQTLKSITTASNNTVIGSQSMTTNTDNTNNVVVGCHVQNDGNSNILLGHNITVTMNDCLEIGHAGLNWLKGYLNDNYGRMLEVSDGTDFKAGDLTISKLSGNINSVLLHDKGKGISFGETTAVSPSTTLTSDDVDIAVEIKADGLHIKDSRALELDDSGSKIKFSDETELTTASFLTTIATNTSNIATNTSDIDANHTEFTEFRDEVNTRFIEGFATEDISGASDGGATASVGTIELREKVDGVWQKPNTAPVNALIYNRDPYLAIKQGDFVVAIKIGGEYRPVWSWGNPNG